jgi:hypothetical protein
MSGKRHEWKTKTPALEVIIKKRELIYRYVSNQSDLRTEARLIEVVLT